MIGFIAANWLMLLRIAVVQAVGYAIFIVAKLITGPARRDLAKAV